MKIGLYYEDIRKGEILKCVNFTRSSYLFENSKGELIDVKEKTNHYKRVTSKKRIQEFEGVILIKPTNRKDRVDFITKKLGGEIVHSLAKMNDKELKNFFNNIYPKYKDAVDYQRPKFEMPICFVCGGETETTWNCACGHAVIDEGDPFLQELKDSGEYEIIRKKYE